MPDLFDSMILAPDVPVLHTTRLTLRAFEPDDAAEFHRLINDWDICRRLPDAPFPYPGALASAWIAAAAADRQAGIAEQFALIERETGRLIGAAGLRFEDPQTADLGYWIGRPFWGQGFGLEAARRVSEFGFAERPIRRITATAAADNDASLAVLRRCGFQPAGKGTRIFMCRPGQKLPVDFFSLAREPEAVQVAPSTVLLVAAAALIDGQGRVLLARRPAGKKMAGMWEFPGGKLEAGETPEVALARELKEELGLETSPEDFAPFVFASHPYENFHLLMPVFLCRRWRGTPVAKEGQALAWVAPERLVEYPMPPADRPLIPMLRDFL